MAKQLRLRRGTTEDYETFKGALGEITYDEDNKTIRVHDGTTIGGFPLTKKRQPRGWTKTEHFVNSGTWTKISKPDLKRIKVEVWGGGGAGNNSSGGGGGGSGGQGYIILDATNLPANVSVTIGAGTTTQGGTGGTTYFGSYILANGGVGAPSSNFGTGGLGGNVFGTGSIDLGGFKGGSGGYSAQANANFGWHYGLGGGPGGGGASNQNATGVRGGGGGVDGSDGAQGSVLIYEIYGEE